MPLQVMDMIQTGGAAAQVGMLYMLWRMHADHQHTRRDIAEARRDHSRLARRVRRIQRFLWPRAYGPPRKDH